MTTSQGLKSGQSLRLPLARGPFMYDDCWLYAILNKLVAHVMAVPIVGLGQNMAGLFVDAYMLVWLLSEGWGKLVVLRLLESCCNLNDLFIGKLA